MAEEDSEKKPENGDEGVPVSGRLFLVLISGFILVIVGIAVILVASVIGGGSTSVGGVIFIGPFPIVFGAGPDALWLIVIGVAIAVLSVVVFIFMRRKIGASGD